MTYTIEPNIPIPDKLTTPKYPFGKMPLYSSFEFDAKYIKQVTAAHSAFGIRHDKKFLVRRIKGGKARCWRTDVQGTWRNGDE